MSNNKTEWVFKGNDDLTRILESVDARFHKVEQATTAAEAKLNNFLGGANGAAMKLNNFAGALKQVGDFIGDTLGKSINLAMEFEQTQMSFKTMLGEERGSAMVDELQNIAETTVLSGESLFNGAKTMAAFGLETEKIVPTMKMIGDISGGNKQNMDALTLAYAQMSSTGKLTGQDLMQMINAGFNPLNEISKKTGVSIGVLKEAMSQGAISAQMVEEAFVLATSEGGTFYGMIDKQSQTAAGQLSIVRDQVNESMKSIGEDLLPTIASGLGFVSESLNWLHENMRGVKTVLLSISTVAGIAALAWAAYTVQQHIATEATSGLTITQALLNATMLNNPFVWVAIAIAAIVTAVIAAYRHSEKFRAVMDGMVEVGKLLWTVYTGVWKVIFGIVTLNRKMVSEGASQVKEIMNIGNAFQRGYDNSLKESASENEKKTSEEKKSTSVSPNVKTPGIDSLKLKGKSKSEAAGEVSKVAGGGSARNITVNIKSLVEKLEVHSTTVKSGVQDVKEQVIDALVSLTRDAEVAIGQ